MEILIRRIKACDADAVARLSGDLGYPATAEEMGRRIERIDDLNDHAIFAACVDGELAGWIDVGVVHHLQAEPYGEIGGLVVAEKQRSRGLGRKLVAQAERWAAERGLTTIRVRSQIAREGAHRFYLREGYERTKISAVFSKQLCP